MNRDVIQELAPTGVLRAGINMSNFLLVTGSTDAGDPTGVSPDMALAVANALGVGLSLVPFATPGELADAAPNDQWDIGNIGAEPQRAEVIAFSPAYCEIEATYMVPAGSSITSIDEVDRPGVRIAVTGRAAYGLWLERAIQHATLVKTDTLDSSFDAFVDQKLDVLAGLRPKLTSDAQKLEGARILDGKFSAVQQAIGTPIKNQTAAAWLTTFVEEAKSSGLVAGLIAKHNVQGLSVAPPL
ncbi:MAG: transporter substrate-binding domain-containing protein [Pseudomonadota bacterium]